MDPNNPIRLDLDLLELQGTLSSDDSGSAEDCSSPDSSSKMDTLDCIGSAFYVSDDRDLEDGQDASGRCFDFPTNIIFFSVYLTAIILHLSSRKHLHV